METSTNLKKELSRVRKKLILDQARRLFLSHGYSAATLDLIAEGIGATKPGIYGSFGSKNDILFRICFDAVKGFHDSALAAAQNAGNPKMAMHTFVRRSVLHACRKIEDQIVYQREEKHLTYDQTLALAALRNETDAVLRRIISAGIADGVFELPNVRLASLLMSGMFGWMPAWYDPEGRLAPEELSDAFAGIGVRMLEPSAGAGNDQAVVAPSLAGSSAGSSAPEPGAPVARNREPVRATILARASELFYRQGYEQTTLDALAQHVGMAKPAIYDHFSSKNEILSEICLRGARMALAATQDVFDIPGQPPQVLRVVIDRFIDVIIENKHHITISRRERKHLQPEIVFEIVRLNRAFDERFRSVLAEGQSRGAFNIKDVPSTALAISGMVCWLYTWHRSGGAAGADAVLKRDMTRMLLRTVSAP
jgi:AcrR family transcriptional regulator